MNKKLPVYNLTISETDLESGVFTISLVNEPAIEIDYFAFSGQTKHTFQFTQIGTPDKQLLAGYLLVPDKLIYRNENGNEFFVRFDKDSIERIATKFNKNKFTSNFNAEHNPKAVLNNVFVKENWIVESTEYDKSRQYGFEPVVGSWFGVVKVDDSAIWNEYIKTGQLKGFSVEGAFEMNYSDAFSKQQSNPIQAYFKKLVSGKYISETNCQ